MNLAAKIPVRLPLPAALKTLLPSVAIASLIALSGGFGFGLALRFSRATSPGSTPWHADQTFPARNDWPVTSASPSRI
jgi:hypothetical protein